MMDRRARTALLLVAWLPLLSGCADTTLRPAAESFLIQGATIVDGTGSPGFTGSLRVVDGAIAEVAAGDGDDALLPRNGEPVHDAGGLVLAPRFHRHAQPPRRRAAGRTHRARGCQPGDHDHRRRTGRWVALPDRGLLRGSRSDSGGGECRFVRGARHAAPTGHGRRLPPRSRRRRGGGHEGDPRDRAGQWSAGPLDRPRVRPGHLLVHGRGGRARDDGSVERGPLHLPHAERGPRVSRGGRGDDRDRGEGTAARADLAHEARRAGSLG